MEDQQLIESALAGNSAAFGELVRKYQDRLYSSLLDLTESPQVARDVAQDAFVTAFIQLESFQKSNDFYTWLHRIACNTPAMGRSVEKNSADQIQTGPEQTPQARLDRDFAQQVLRQAEKEMLTSGGHGRPGGLSWRRLRRPVLWASLTLAAGLLILFLDRDRMPPPQVRDPGVVRPRGREEIGAPAEAEAPPLKAKADDAASSQTLVVVCDVTPTADYKRTFRRLLEDQKIEWKEASAGLTLVEASESQIEALLAALHRDADVFASIDVEPAPSAPRQRRWKRFARRQASKKRGEGSPAKEESEPDAAEHDRIPAIFVLRPLPAKKSASGAKRP